MAEEKKSEMVEHGYKISFKFKATLVRVVGAKFEKEYRVLFTI